MALLGICKPTGKPAWSRDASIGDYGGSLDKRASETEGETPYAYAMYRDIQSQRGSAYTTEADTMVHVETLALARTLGYTFFRHPEKARANATPARSDERLEYWVAVLGIPVRATDQRWQIRERAAAHYQATKGPTLANVIEAVSALLGDAYVSIETSVGTDIATPPTLTNWPVVNPGPASYSLGAGAWLSERCHLTVIVDQPAGMSDGDFNNLIQVQMFALLDRMLPAWATFGWATSEGFLLDISQLDYAGL